MKIIIKGCTRLVILHGSFAYKIARVRPLKVLLKLMVIFVSYKHCISLFEKYDRSIFRALWKYLFAGLYANLAEEQYWNETHDVRCVPVLQSWCGGWIISQSRAQVVTLEMVQDSSLRDLLAERELGGSHQYGWYKGQCHIIDYAHWNITKL